MATTHEESSGNVFADLGVPNSEQELVKAKLTVQIYQILKERKVTQTEPRPAWHHPGTGLRANALPPRIRLCRQADALPHLVGQ